MKRIVTLVVPFFLLSVCLSQIHTATNSGQIKSLKQSDTYSANQLPLTVYKHRSRLALEMWASNNSVNPENIFTKNYINHQIPSISGNVAAENLTEWKTLVANYHQSFSNSQVKILTQIAENNLVATHWTFTATQTGTYVGLAPTGKRVSWSGIEIDRFEHGKIAESWVTWDMYDLFSQLGLIKKGPQQQIIAHFK